MMLSVLKMVPNVMINPAMGIIKNLIIVTHDQQNIQHVIYALRQIRVGIDHIV